MGNPFNVPGYSVQEVAAKLAGDGEFILLDVREPVELLYANLGERVTKLPLSVLAEQQLEALPDEIATDKDAEVVVMCHHGNRSAQVTAWLRQQGWTQVFNMDGGIDAYAIAIDPKIGRY